MAKKNSTTANLPKEIFGVRDGSGTDDLSLNFCSDPRDVVEDCEAIRAGVYKLVGYATISNQIEVKMETAGNRSRKN